MSRQVPNFASISAVSSSFSILKRVFLGSQRSSKNFDRSSFESYLPQGVRLESTETREKYDAITIAQTSLAKILDCYFSQLYFEGPWFLDFSPNSFVQAGTTIYWCPRSFEYELPEDLRTSLRKLYCSYFQFDDEGFAEALLELRLAKNNDSLSELKSILLDHLMNARTHQVEPDFIHLAKSSLRLFGYFVKHNIRVQPELEPFSYSLVSLYRCLRESEEPIDFQKAFKIAHKRNHNRTK